MKTFALVWGALTFAGAFLGEWDMLSWVCIITGVSLFITGLVMRWE